MKKVAIFGNTGGGKSTLAKTLAEITGLPLVVIDKIMYLPGGKQIPHEKYLSTHSALINEDEWLVDGFGCMPSAWQRFAAADTLIYIDLPLITHFAWVTKRFVKCVFVNPEGWPDRSPKIRSTINSYRVLWLCHSKLTPRYRQFVSESASKKQVIHLKSTSDIKEFINTVRSAQQSAQHKCDGTARSQK